MTKEDGNFEVRGKVQKRSISNTIEFPLCLNMAASSLTSAAISNILLYRTCVNSLGISKEECSPFLSPVQTNETSDIESEVQRYTTLVTTVKGVLDAVIPACLALFLGAWSNMYGRKPLLMWSLAGSSLSNLLTAIYSMIDGLGPWWHIISIVPSSITGSYIVLYTGAYCYISDMSPKKDIALRMAMIEATISSGTVIGSTLSSYLIIYIGSVNLLLLATSLNTIAFLFVTVIVKESLMNVNKGGSTKILRPSLVKDLLNECLKKRPFNRRALILLLTISNFLLVIITIGLKLVEYLFTRKQLGWSLQQYTRYSAISTTLSFIGKFVGVLVVKKLLRLGDITFIIFGMSTAVIEYIIKILAVKSWNMYVGATVSMFKDLTGPMTRSFLSKTFLPGEVSKIFALMCAVDSIAPIITPIIFNSLYAATIDVLPGSFYILSIAISLTCLIMFGFVQYYKQKAPKTTTTENVDSSDPPS